jgi:hypothetical protein
MVKERPPSPNFEFNEIQPVVEGVAHSGMAG